jgi:MFS family permease
VKELLRAQGLRSLLIGQSISALGDWMGTIAVLFLVQHVTGSAAALGGVLVVRLLPGLLAGPLAARATARWGRRGTMLTMDAARAGMVLLLPIVPHIWWIYVWSVLIEGAGLVFLPARDASTKSTASMTFSSPTDLFSVRRTAPSRSARARTSDSCTSPCTSWICPWGTALSCSSSPSIR